METKELLLNEELLTIVGGATFSEIEDLTSIDTRHSELEDLTLKELKELKDLI